MATVKYSRVKEYLRSLTGIDDFSSQEEGFLKSAFNRRVRMAYEETRFWPAYTREELRYAGFNNVIPFTQKGKNEIDTFHDIHSANPRTNTTNAIRYDWVTRHDGAKILGLEDGDQDAVQYTWTKNTVNSGKLEDISAGGTTAKAIGFWLKAAAPTSYGAGTENAKLLYINADGNGIPSGDGFGNLLFTVTSSGSVVQVRNGWVESEGTTMFVYADGILLGTDYGNGDAGVNIQDYFDGEWHHFIWTLRPSATTPQNVGNFHYELNSDTDQTHDISMSIADVRVYEDNIDAVTALAIYNSPTSIDTTPLWASNVPEYFVSYKASLTTRYGDASGEEDDVPVEFLEYGVHGAYADWLRGEGQTDKAMAEEGFAREHLQRQLERIHYTNGSPYLWSRFSTHTTRQRR